MNKAFLKNFFLVLFVVFALQSSLSAQSLTSRSQQWNDTVRVVVIWNSGTGGDGLPPGWNAANGDIGRDTKNFVQKSLQLLNQDNVKYYTSNDPAWATITSYQSLRNAAFNGKTVHAIVYINAGYVWEDRIGRTHPPYPILDEATKAGVGVVAVGDDAAYDAKQVFNVLRGPNGENMPIQYSDPMFAGDPQNWPNIRDLWISLDKSADENLPDGGLLYAINKDTLSFKLWQVGGRGQADADAWSVNVNELDNYSFVGYQQGRTTANQTLIGSTPDNPIMFNSKRCPQYNVIAGLEQGNHRIVMLDYQPQYLSDNISSMQVVYNSVYWASKAHEPLKIPTPTANPPSGEIPIGSSIVLKVALANRTLYKIYYSINGGTPVQGDTIRVITDQPFTLRTWALPTNPQNWLNSDSIDYKYTVSKMIISANPGDGTRFGSDTSVTLSTNITGTRIYYTLDGSTPDSTSTLYTGSITITKTTTIKAVAYKTDMLPATGAWTYTQREPIRNIINDQTFYIKERSTAGTTIGNISIEVSDPVQAVLTQIGNLPEFTFNISTRAITVADGAVLNYDNKDSYTFKLAAVVTNAFALKDTATITIRLIADSLIPVTATLLDTNHNGHIDKIDITWTDSSKMKPELPAISQLIRNFSLTTLSNQYDSLHAISFVPEFANKLFHIILNENNQYWETGWNSANISFYPVSVSVKGGYFQVTKIVNGTSAIPISACYSPGSSKDTLVVTFSSKPDSTGNADYLQQLKVIKKSGERTLSSLNAVKASTRMYDIFFTVPTEVLSPYEDSVSLSFLQGPASPFVNIGYCHPLPLDVIVKAGPNPFTPNKDVPPGRHDDDPKYGIRIEIVLNSSHTSSVGGENRPSWCTIFDAVGNVIISNVPLKADPNSARKKYFIWNGKNKYGMTVAGGTYLARILVEDKISGSKSIKNINIGVKTVK
jgi:hypothetical protein